MSDGLRQPRGGGPIRKLPLTVAIRFPAESRDVNWVASFTHRSGVSGFLRHPSEITSRIMRFTAPLQAGYSARNYFRG